MRALIEKRIHPLQVSTAAGFISGTLVTGKLHVKHWNTWRVHWSGGARGKVVRKIDISKIDFFYLFRDWVG